MKKAIWIIYFLFFINLIELISGAKIGISPANLNFSMSINEKICREVILFSDSNETLIGETKWNSLSIITKNLNLYKLEPSYFEISVEFPENIKVEGKKKIELCLTGKKSGKYYGALIYHTEKGYAGVGSWITMEVDGNIFEETKRISLTGKVIEDKISSINKIKTCLGIIFLFLIIDFIAIVVMRKKKV